MVLAKARDPLDLSPCFIPQRLHPSIWDQAKLFFISKNVMAKPSPFEYMPQFYHGQNRDNYLATTVMAVMFAYFYRTTRSDTAAGQAATAYGQALHRTQKALQSVETATHDEMLFTVLLLYLTEKFIGPYQGSTCHSSSHTHGVIALVRARGHPRFQNLTCQCIFAQLMDNVLVDSIQQYDEAPSDLTCLLRVISPTDPTIKVKWTFLNIMAEYAALRSAIHKCLVRDKKIVNMARELCEKLQRVYDNLPNIYSFWVVPSSPASIIPIHQYENDLGRRFRNRVRMLHIILEEMVLQYCHSVSKIQGNGLNGSDIENTMSSSISSISSLSLGICASVPQCVRPDYKQNFIGDTRPIHDVDDLLFPLHVVTRSSACPSDVQDWALATLQHLVEREVKMTFTLRGFPCEEGDEDVWTAYARLGNVIL